MCARNPWNVSADRHRRFPAAFSLSSGISQSLLRRVEQGASVFDQQQQVQRVGR